MKNTNKLLNAAVVAVIALCISANISASERMDLAMQKRQEQQQRYLESKKVGLQHVSGNAAAAGTTEQKTARAMQKRQDQQARYQARKGQGQQAAIAEEPVCCIEGVGCTEDQGVGPIPCRNKHSDLICNSCLDKIKSSTNLCPMCREPLL